MKVNVSVYLSLIVFFLFLTSSNVIAQNGFKTGYIVNKLGEKTKGLINVEKWKQEKTLIFKSKKGEKSQSIDLNTLKEFGIDKETYQKHEIEIEVSPRASKKLDFNNKLQIETAEAFLQVLFKGDKNLLYYITPNKKVNFYIIENDTISLLKYKRYLKIVEGKAIIKEDRSYLWQLQNYLEDCPAVGEQLKRVDYQRRNLELLFRDYYKCTGKKIRHKDNVPVAIIENGLLAGLSMSKINFETNNYNGLSDIDFKPSINFTAGLYFDLSLSSLPNWTLGSELLFTYYNTKGNHIIDVNGVNYIENLTFHASYGKINFLLNYKLPINKYTYHFNVGISNGLLLSEENIKKIEFNVSTSLHKIHVLNDVKTYEFGWIIGAGLKHKRYGAEIRYERGTGISKYDDLKTPNQRYYLIFKYRLFDNL